MSILLILLVLILIFGFWSVVKGILWLTLVLIGAFIVTGLIGGRMLKKR